MQTYHIISSKNKWCVKKQGATKALRVFKCRELAFGWAMVNLKMNDVIIVHSKDASVEFQIMPYELNKDKNFINSIDAILSWGHIEFTLSPYIPKCNKCYDTGFLHIHGTPTNKLCPRKCPVKTKTADK